MALPLVITVAPNGARRTKADHPALPIDPREIGLEAEPSGWRRRERWSRFGPRGWWFRMRWCFWMDRTTGCRRLSIRATGISGCG